jgi:hypothetical protein
MFDQRRQVVGYQNNAFGNINIGSVGHVGSPAHLLEQLARLRDQIATAERSGSLDKDLADATDEQLAKARQLAERPQADKRLIIGRLNAARSLVESVAAAGGALAGLATAIGELAQQSSRIRDEWIRPAPSAGRPTKQRQDHQSDLCAAPAAVGCGRLAVDRSCVESDRGRTPNRGAGDKPRGYAHHTVDLRGISEPGRRAGSIASGSVRSEWARPRKGRHCLRRKSRTSRSHASSPEMRIHGSGARRHSTGSTRSGRATARTERDRRGRRSGR